MKILYTLIMLFVSICMSAQTLKGDMDDDGDLTITDVTMLINAYLNYEKMPEEGTNDENEPTVTGNATNVTSYAADITAWANSIMDSEATDLKVGIIYCTEGTPNKSNGTQQTVSRNQIDSEAKYTVTLSGLAPGTTYYYRSFVYQSGLYFYGKVMSFTTVEQGAHFTTGDVTSLTCFSAKVSATATVDEGYKISEYGICYGTESEPTQMLKATSRDADGNYTVQLRALAGNTTYYYRPYVYVDGYLKYGPVSSFVTRADNVVVTGEYDEETSSVVGNRLTLSGGAFSTLEVGVCWSATNEEPTVNDKCASTNELDDVNEYVVAMRAFYVTTYYRAYVKIDGVAHYGKVDTAVREPNVNDYDYVDLGLPSGTFWATCNVGALSPEEYGEYFAWGETIKKYSYNWSTYRWCKGSYDAETKYCTSSSFGTYDNKTVLDPEDDVAHVNWGGDWRMPTKEEQDELCDPSNCTWIWTEMNGVDGYKVVSKTNGNFLFLPAAGCRYDSRLNSAGFNGYYWSSSLESDYPGNAYTLNFNSVSFLCGSGNRCFGVSVRPVCQ